MIVTSIDSEFVHKKRKRQGRQRRFHNFKDKGTKQIGRSIMKTTQRNRNYIIF